MVPRLGIGDKKKICRPTLCFWNQEKWKHSSCLSAVVFHFLPDTSCFTTQTGKPETLKQNNWSSQTKRSLESTKDFWLLTYLKAACIMSAFKSLFPCCSPPESDEQGSESSCFDMTVRWFITRLLFIFNCGFFSFFCVSHAAFCIPSLMHVHATVVPLTPKCLFWHVGQQSGHLLTHFDTGPVIFLHAVHMLSTCFRIGLN